LQAAAGVFSLDGQHFDVENNIWLIGDEYEVLVADAAHDAAPIAAAVRKRSVRAILCTPEHNDHQVDPRSPARVAQRELRELVTPLAGAEPARLDARLRERVVAADVLGRAFDVTRRDALAKE
jgi:hypothetical protein